MENNIPWVEKYRPNCIKNIVLEDTNKKLINQASLATMTLPEGNEQGKQTMKGFKVICILESA